MSNEHSHGPVLTGDVERAETVSFDIQPVLLVLVTVCVIVTTVITIKSYVERQQKTNRVLGGLYPTEKPESLNGAVTATKEAKA